MNAEMHCNEIECFEEFMYHIILFTSLTLSKFERFLQLIDLFNLEWGITNNFLGLVILPFSVF